MLAVADHIGPESDVAFRDDGSSIGLFGALHCFGRCEGAPSNARLKSALGT
jgi:hypothetical protein